MSARRKQVICMKEKLYPLLFGGDINVYSVARAFWEQYRIRVTCYGKFPSGPAYRSSLIDYRVNANAEKAETLVRLICDFAAEHGDGKVMPIGCSDDYVFLVTDNRDKYPDNVIVPYIDSKLMGELIRKEHFYELADRYDIDHPGTFIYRKEMGHDFELPFKPPYICKPSSSALYWRHPFQGNDKVFVLKDREALLDVLDRCYAAGYPDTMVIQDMIPGDDSYMRVLTCYSDRKGRVRMMCLGHTLLEEHTPHGRGNHAVVITEKLDGQSRTLCEKIRHFLEEIHYTGFSNFDIKYDERDGKYKVFEINCRQGRSNYYVTAAGYNVAKYWVSDLIEGIDTGFEICQKESLWRVVPRKVSYDYVPSKYHAFMKRMEKEGHVSNSLISPDEKNWYHKLWVWHNLRSHVKKFASYYEKQK